MATNIGILGSTLDLIISAKLTPTEHLLLKAFLTEAADPEYAARYISQRIKNSGDRNVEEVLREIKQDWKQLVMKFSKTAHISPEMANLVKSRDGMYGCLAPVKDKLDVTDVALIEPAWIIPPKLFDDEEMVPQRPLFPLLNAFLTPARTKQLQEIICDRNEARMLRNLWLLSPSIHSAFRNGHIQIIPSTGLWTWNMAEDDQENAMTVQYTIVRQCPEEPMDIYFSDGTPFSAYSHTFTVHTDNPTTHCLPSSFLFHVHHMIASSLHLFFIEDRIATGWPPAPLVIWSKPAQQIMRKVWHFVPKIIRVYFYDIMSKVGKYFYPSDHALVRQLPFGLYWKSCGRSGQNEAVALQLVEKYTSVPAPLWIDDYEENGNTTLIMTSVPGQPLQSVFHRLSYQEREQLSKDLKIIISELRRIPNRTPYRFANTLGRALFDYRVGEFGPFVHASDFHKYLIPEYTPAETRKAIAPIHSRHHSSVFTHADINWTNILIDQGRLTGLVDWECAGYYPEYWEFTKAMYGIINDEAMEKVVHGTFDQDYTDELKVEKKLWKESPWGI